MIRIHNLKFKITEDSDIQTLRKKAAAVLKVDETRITDIKIAKKSIDARNKNDIYYIYSADLNISGKYFKSRTVETVEPFTYHIKKSYSKERPVIAGFGPAGMMAALVLSKAGLNPIVIERGKDVDSRKKDVEDFFRTGVLNTESNVQFGEGGAGTFSDGKLTTGIKDKRCLFVLKQFVKFGAPEEILYINKPHIGTDKLTGMVKALRHEIISLGGEVRFENKLVDFITEKGCLRGIVAENRCGERYELSAGNLILAIGHSARDTFDIIYKRNIEISPKPFAIGVRIEHPQSAVNKAQYGSYGGILPPAEYKFAFKAGDRNVFTFCMCPGGQVISASSEGGCVVTNGMSFNDRACENANSALIVSVNNFDYASYSSGPLAGIEFQRALEKKAFEIGGGNYKAPVQLVRDFLSDKETCRLGSVIPSYRPGVTPCDLREVLPGYITDALKTGLSEISKRLEGFNADDAVMTAVETRTSSPVRIRRDNAFHSGIKGLIPCGEGCGHAGGIMSAAVDGIKCAESVLAGGIYV